MEPTVDKAPRQVKGQSQSSILSRKLSFSIHHITPRALSIGKGSTAKFSSLIPFARSSIGKGSEDFFRVRHYLVYSETGLRTDGLTKSSRHETDISMVV